MQNKTGLVAPWQLLRKQPNRQFGILSALLRYKLKYVYNCFQMPQCPSLCYRLLKAATTRSTYKQRMELLLLAPDFSHCRRKRSLSALVQRLLL